MNSKLYDILRKLQWLIPALATFYGVIDQAFSIGADETVYAISAALVALIGVILQHESDKYFSEKDIVNKIDPVESVEAEG